MKLLNLVAHDHTIAVSFHIFEFTYKRLCILNVVTLFVAVQSCLCSVRAVCVRVIKPKSIFVVCLNYTVTIISQVHA